MEPAEKTDMFIQCAEGGLTKVKIEEEEVIKGRCLTDQQAQTIAQLMIKLEKKMDAPQDFEWGIEKGKFINVHDVHCNCLELYC